MCRLIFAFVITGCMALSVNSVNDFYGHGSVNVTFAELVTILLEHYAVSNLWPYTVESPVSLLSVPQSLSPPPPRHMLLSQKVLEKMDRTESIQWLTEGQAFLRSYYLYSRPPPPPLLPSVSLTDNTSENWEKKASCWPEGGGEEEPNHTTARKHGPL